MSEPTDIESRAFVAQRMSTGEACVAVDLEDAKVIQAELLSIQHQHDMDSVRFEEMQQAGDKRDAENEQLRGQIVALREVLEMLFPVVVSYRQLASEVGCSDEGIEAAFNHAQAALSTPAIV